MYSDRETNFLSEQVYLIDALEAEKQKTLQYRVGDLLVQVTPAGKQQYRIVDSEETDNGMQAMTVAKLDNNDQIDMQQLVIAYAGTNPSDVRDLISDGLTVVMGVKMDSQAKSAEVYANKIRQKYANSTITLTGHSLGGYNALYTAAKLKLPVTVYNAPNVNNILSEDEERWLRENKDKVVNYKDSADGIGYGGGIFSGEYFEGIAESYNIQVNRRNSFSLGGKAHDLKTWQQLMNSDGNISDSQGIAYKQKISRTLPISEWLSSHIPIVKMFGLAMFTTKMIDDLKQLSNAPVNILPEKTNNIRDFSMAMKDRLLQIIKPLNMDTISATHLLGQASTVEQIIGYSMGIETEIFALEKYYTKCIDIDNWSMRKIESAFDKVYALDTQFADEVANRLVLCRALQQKIERLSDSIVV